MSIPNADNIIYNMTLYNDQNNSIVAERYVSRDQPFINNVQDYYIRLIGANISTLNIPLFIYKNNMSILITNNGLQSSRITVNFPSIAQENNIVVFVQQFLDGLNSALRLAHIQSLSPGNPPLFIFDESIQLIIDQAYNPVLQQILVNDKLIDKMPSLYSIYSAAEDMFILNYGNYHNNMYNSFSGGINYPIYISDTNVPGYHGLQEYDNILVTCSSVPINRQLISSSNNTSQSLGILASIPLTYEDVTRNSQLIYDQTFPVYNDLLSRGVLSEIDFKLYLVDQNYLLTPLFIEPKASITLRIEFINKQIVKNHYPNNFITPPYKL